MKRVIAVMALGILVASCAHVISGDAVKRSTRDVPFRIVSQNIENYTGQTFIWGGLIARARLTEKGGELEVVQHPLTRQGYIRDTDTSEGRFIVLSTKPLDPMVYEKGRYVTVSGVLTGSEKRRMKDFEYEYPVLEAGEIYLWSEDRYYPGDYYYPYYPYYYPYDPYWYYPYPHYRRHR